MVVGERDDDKYGDLEQHQITTMSLTEEKKRRRRSTVIRATYPDWYPWVSLGLGGYAASGSSEGGSSGEGSGSMGESTNHFDQIDAADRLANDTSMADLSDQSKKS